MKEAREIVRAVIWKIAKEEGGNILHYNDWVDDNWDELELEALLKRIHIIKTRKDGHDEV